MRLLSTISVFVFALSVHMSAQTAMAQKNDAIGSAINSWEIGDKVNIDNHVDPIVTGQALSAEDLAEWKLRKKRFLECGLCGQEQAFPGDLPN
ncbi:MAG: hypothetical protein AB8B49_11085 [Nitratireductor sp.]